MTASQHGGLDPDGRTVAAIVAQVIDRRRDGEHLDASEYIAKHPHLRERILSQLRVVDLLEQASAERLHLWG